MPIMEISVVPIGTEKVSVSQYVADAVKILQNESIKYELTAMGTIIESDSLNKLFDIAEKMHSIVLNKTERVVTSIKIDHRKDKKSSIKNKIKSVKNKL